MAARMETQDDKHTSLMTTKLHNIVQDSTNLVVYLVTKGSLSLAWQSMIFLGWVNVYKTLIFLFRGSCYKWQQEN